MRYFFYNFDWNSFWMNVLVSAIFFIISIPVAIQLIPYFTIKKLRQKNKKYIVRKISSVIQETCEYINSLPFKDKELNQHHVAIFTTKKDLKTHRFVGVVNINVFNPISFPKIILVVVDYFKKLDIDSSFDLLQVERKKLEVFRLKLESIIDIHSLHIDDKTISEISDICLEIRSFEITFEVNNAIDDLIESGQTKRFGVFGIMDIARIYEKILFLLKNLLVNKDFNIEITKK